MFYAVEAFLLEKGLTSSKHAGVHSLFGEHFVKTGLEPLDYHRSLVRAMEIRHAADYGKGKTVTPEEAAKQFSNAEDFLKLPEQLMGPLPPSEQVKRPE